MTGAPPGSSSSSISSSSSRSPSSGTDLSGDVTLDGFLEFAALFVPVWWAGGLHVLRQPLRHGRPRLPIARVDSHVRSRRDGGERPPRLRGRVDGLRLVVRVREGRLTRPLRPCHPVRGSGRSLASLYFTAFGVAVVIWLTSLALPHPPATGSGRSPLLSRSRHPWWVGAWLRSARSIHATSRSGSAS